MEMEKNVIEFSKRAERMIGRWKADGFGMEIYMDISNKKISSPIEQILYIALRTAIKIEHLELATVIKLGSDKYLWGICIQPQYKILNYKVDFLVSDCRIEKKESVIVECDSQTFHERTEQERRYEKARDRIFINEGYKIFHYTGKEIIEKPFDIAIEILSRICDLDGLMVNYIEDN